MPAEKLRAIVAVCHHRPFNCGHVGWGYEHSDGSWRVGAVEGPGWQGVFNGFWSRKVNGLNDVMVIFENMKKLNAEYDNVKLLNVGANVSANPVFADEMSAWVSGLEYSVINRNCMDSAFDILNAYAPGYVMGVLPKPEDNWFPNDWYKNLPSSTEYNLSNAIKTQPDVLLSENKQSVDDLSFNGTPPPWRIIGNENYFPPRKGRPLPMVR
ncbi:hypothetical protein EPN18_05340 [bacterium]|nr:MAG: hypothetical protein EPN18_05340 [bacterium]